MVCLDKYGYPVTGFEGKPIINFIRKLIHTRKIVRKWTPPEQKPNPNVACYDSQKDL